MSPRRIPEKEPCENCDGKGRVECYSCQGSGTYDAELDGSYGSTFYVDECPECDGEGDLECPECYGEGTW